MKVLLINNFFYRKGGSEAVFFNTADVLIQSGHEVVFFSIEDENNICASEHAYLIPAGSTLKKVRNYFSNPDAARKLDMVLKAEKPDIAHAHLFWGGISPSIFAILHKHGIPLVHTVHDYRMICPAYTFRNGQGHICEKCMGGRFIECFKNRCSKGSPIQSALMAIEMYIRNQRWHPATGIDGLIYVSEFSKRKHEELDPRLKSIHNIVLYNFTMIGEQFPVLTKDSGYYLYYGRLSYEKGINSLIDAFAKFPNLALKVVGTGPIEGKLKDLGYANVEFLGYKSGDELYNLVRNARYVCIPSEWYENNPMAIVESYSLGVPVIGARIGGIPEIVVEGETGFLFESGDEDSLEETLKRSIMVNEEKYHAMKLSSLQFARDHFHHSNYLNKLVAFYESTISNQLSRIE